MIVCLGTTPALARTMEFTQLAVDGVNRATRVFEYPAGKAVNAARAAATLREPVVCVSPVGGSTSSRFLAAPTAFEQAFVRVQSEMRLCVTVVDRSAGTSTELVQDSPSLDPQDGDRLLELLVRHAGKMPASLPVAVLSGSLASGLPGDFYARSIAAAREKHCQVILDTSGEALRSAIEERPEIVKINRDELAGLNLGNGSNIANRARELAKRSGGWVIITRGKESTLAIHANAETFEVDVPSLKTISAIGSGDSFAGALAVGIGRGWKIEDALVLATAAAAANAMTADAAHFDLDAVERLRTQVKLTPLLRF